MQSRTSMIVASPIRPVRLTASRRRRSRWAAVCREPRNSHAPQAIRRMAASPKIEISTAPPDTKTLAPASNIERYSSPENKSAADWSFLEDLGIILQELIEPLIREGMVEQHVQDLQRHRGDVGAGHGSFNYMR